LFQSPNVASIFDFFGTTTLIVNTINASRKRKDQLAQQHHANLVNQLEMGEIFPGRGKKSRNQPCMTWGY
jgi:hypothetical protein